MVNSVAKRLMIAVLGVAVTLSLLTAGIFLFIQNNPPPESGSPAQKAVGEGQLLFVQTGTSGTFTKTDHRGVFTLKISGVPDSMVWFSDRPQRDAGSLPVEAFVRAWKGFGFDKNPPNAAIELTYAKEHEDTIVVELRNPALDTQHHTIQYEATVLEAVENDRFANFSRRAEESIPSEFSSVTLFIDSAAEMFIGWCALVPYTSCPELNAINRNELAGKNLEHADFTNANFVGADLSGTKFDDSILIGAVFDQNKLDNASFYRAIVDEWGINYLMQHGGNGISPYLQQPSVDTTKKDFTNKDLSTYVFDGVDFSNADFSGAKMKSFFCNNCNMSGAKFVGTDLSYAHFERSDFSNADFSNANLYRTFFQWNKFPGAKSETAKISQIYCVPSDATTSRQDTMCP